MRRAEKLRQMWDDIFYSRLVARLEADLKMSAESADKLTARFEADLKTSAEASDKLTARLGEDLLRLRQDFEARIQEYQNMVADLRNEKAMLQGKLAIFELSIQQKAGIDPSRMSAKKPSFASFESPQPMTRWQQVQMEHEKELAREAAEDKSAALAQV